MNTKHPDILVFMSDQHTSYYSGFFGHNVDTPNMNRLSQDGTTFDACYCANPLCGPSRASMLCCRRSAQTGIFHRGELSDMTPTFLHYLVEAGYETTLIGRMHFRGEDQYHGFMHHIGGDFTPVTMNYRLDGAALRRERGVFSQTDTFSSFGAATVSGGGDSPVLSYDRHIIQTALDYLEAGGMEDTYEKDTCDNADAVGRKPDHTGATKTDPANGRADGNADHPESAGEQSRSVQADHVTSVQSETDAHEENHKENKDNREAGKDNRSTNNRPQCIFVSLYGPHFPYVAPKDLYLKYLDRVKLSDSRYAPVNSPLIADLQSDVTDEVYRSCLAAYCGMIEQVDEELGEIREAFSRFTQKRKTKSVFVYTSDHGDNCGDHGIFGKENFYEKAMRIPLLFAGDGIASGQHVDNPVGLMDLGPTLLDLAGAKPLRKSDGTSLVPALEGKDDAALQRPVIAEFMYRNDGKRLLWPDDPDTPFVHAMMIREGDYKYIHYENADPILYNIRKDPLEMHDISKEEPAILQSFEEKNKELAMDKEAHANFDDQREAERMYSIYEAATGSHVLDMRWRANPERDGQYPDPGVIDLDAHTKRS